ncbi:MAG: hypothetical protein ACI8XQ_000800 [Bermanella sp.]
MLIRMLLDRYNRLIDRRFVLPDLTICALLPITLI